MAYSLSSASVLPGFTMEGEVEGGGGGGVQAKLSIQRTRHFDNFAPQSTAVDGCLNPERALRFNDHQGGKEICRNPEAGPIRRNPAAKRFPFVTAVYKIFFCEE